MFTELLNMMLVTAVWVKARQSQGNVVEFNREWSPWSVWYVWSLKHMESALTI